MHKSFATRLLYVLSRTPQAEATLLEPKDSPSIKKQVFHFIGNPVSAKRFVEPVLEYLNKQGYACRVVIDTVKGDPQFANHISVDYELSTFLVSHRPAILLRGIGNMYRYFRKHRIDVVHAHQTLSALLPLLFAWLFRIPTRIYHNHGSVFRGTSGILRFALIELERLNCGLATHVIFVSDGLRRDFLEARILSVSKAHVIGVGSACGIDLEGETSTLCTEEVLQLKNKLGFEANIKIGLYVGRPFKRKGFPFLVNWWAREHETFPDLALVVLGCTQTDVTNCGGNAIPRLRALGYVENVRDFYAISDFLILPSESEGFSYAVLEAFIAKRCVVASNVPGLRDQIADRKTGLLFDYDIPSSLSSTVTYLLAFPSIKEELVREAFDYAQAFDRHSHFEALGRFYEDVC